MARLEWYAVQVSSGQERKLARMIEVACAEAPEGGAGEGRLLLDECFAPRYRAQKKMRGEWRGVERALMPGYLIAVTDDPVALAQRLRRISDFCRVVKAGQAYVPLDDFERAWLEANTSRGDRVVPMSFGRKVGDVLEVTQGPLKGHEGRIVGVRRSDSLATLEFHVGSVKIKTTVGLGILPG